MEEVLKGMENFEVVVSASGVLPTGDYENQKPLYSIKASFPNSEAKRLDEIMLALRSKVFGYLDSDYQRAMMKRIEKVRGDIRWKEKAGKIYISVTSILGWRGIDYDPYLLAQYAARGTILHKIAEVFLIGLRDKGKGVIIDPEKAKELSEQVAILKGGSLGLHWKDCSFERFWEKHGGDFDLKGSSIEEPIFNETYLYCGTPDLVCNHEKVRTVCDWKTSSNYSDERLIGHWKQLSAYARAKGAGKMAILPLNPKNKSGFGKPIIEENVGKYFRMFVKERETFRKYFQM